MKDYTNEKVYVVKVVAEDQTEFKSYVISNKHKTLPFRREFARVKLRHKYCLYSKHGTGGVHVFLIRRRYKISANLACEQVPNCTCNI